MDGTKATYKAMRALKVTSSPLGYAKEMGLYVMDPPQAMPYQPMSLLAVIWITAS